MNPRLGLALLATTWLALPCAAAETRTSPRAALVIGNAKYEASVGSLRNAVSDARAVAKTLRGLGFAVIEEHNVTRDELLEAVAEFRTKLRGTEVALFYYAGHGISVAGSNYLIPVKSGYLPEGADDPTLRLLAETKLFNAEQVSAEMSAAGGRCNLVILDACRTTPVARNPRTRELANPGGLTEMKPPAGSLIAFATDAGRTAQDGAGANGLYTEELLKHLRTSGLTIEQVFKRTRAGVMQRSAGAQIPAEYSRLVGDDIYLAGPASGVPAATPAGGSETAAVGVPRRVLKAEPVRPPTSGAMNKLAAAGKAAECVEALKLTAASRGAGDYAAAPLDTLLELAKEDLKEATVPSPKVEAAMKTCDLVLESIPECLPPEHAQKAALTAKAQNRRGDCLLILGRPAEALPAYNSAILLAPEDAYPIFNRGRAQLALGRMDEAKADFTAAAGPKFKQPKARQLALKALTELP
ncbi:MAG: caspase family protein [Verrucomicrobia bacterium]|nr:caspase family protein [Verrucomicrobiota bacterium]